MLTFLQYTLFEAAIDRKIQKGFSDPPVEIPGSTIIHHDPKTKTTVYHMLNPKAAYTFGSRTDWCTATPRNSYAHDYLQRGNLFGIIKGENRFNYHIDETPSRSGERKLEFNDVHNDPAPIDTLPRDVHEKLHNEPYHEFHDEWVEPPHQYTTMTKQQIINHIKTQDSRTRHAAFLSMVDGPEGRGLQNRHHNDAKSFEVQSIISNRLNAGDLHHFHDDPNFGRFVASNASNIDAIASTMRDHPDPEVQKIVRNRVQQAGGESALIPQHQPSSFVNDPNQLQLKFPTVPRKKK